MSEIENRFTRLANDVPKGLKIHTEEVAPTNERARLADELRSWASSSDCSRVFLPHLSRLIRLEEEQERMVVRSHPDICYHMGRRDALRDLLASFTEWADKASSAPDPEMEE